MVASQLTADFTDNNTAFTLKSNVKIGMLLKKLLLPNPTFELHEKHSTSRTKVENYIAQHFEQVYDAQVCSFSPVLMTMRCNSAFSAAVGMRSASHADRKSVV